MEKRIQEGPAIYVESLMTAKEVKERCKLYGSSTKSELRSLAEFEVGEMKWRYRMGESVTEEEIKIINARIEEVMRKAKLK